MDTTNDNVRNATEFEILQVHKAGTQPFSVVIYLFLLEIIYMWDFL